MSQSEDSDEYGIGLCPLEDRFDGLDEHMLFIMKTIEIYYHQIPNMPMDMMMLLSLQCWIYEYKPPFDLLLVKENFLHAKTVFHMMGLCKGDESMNDRIKIRNLIANAYGWDATINYGKPWRPAFAK